MEQSKACSRCKQILPYEAFNKKASTPTGYNSACRECANAMKRDMSPKQRERKNAKNRKYRAENREAVKLTNRKQYLNKREERIAAAILWIENNRELHSLYQRRNAHKHRERNAGYARARRAKLKLNGTYAISLQEVRNLISKPCFYCGKIGKSTIDHVIPIELGGVDGIGNLVPACKSCNSSKSDLTIMQWRLKRARMGKPLPLAYAQVTGAFRS
jgi:5-methylcytosine-specific restriction endonuclease McrA